VPARLTPIQRHSEGRLPLITRTLLLVAPAVLAAAALRSRSGRSGSSGGSASTGSGSSPFSG
jgi:periplasmic protein TonB